MSPLSGHDGPVNEDSSAAGAEHLQNAARELISAGRLFLDAAAELVEDPEVLTELTDTFRGLVGDLARRRRNSPLWERTEGDWGDDGSREGEDTASREREVGTDSDQTEIDLLVRRRDRLINLKGTDRRFNQQNFSEDNMAAMFGRMPHGYDSWEAIAKDAIKELEKYR